MWPTLNFVTGWLCMELSPVTIVCLRYCMIQKVKCIQTDCDHFIPKNSRGESGTAWFSLMLNKAKIFLYIVGQGFFHWVDENVFHRSKAWMVKQSLKLSRGKNVAQDCICSYTQMGSTTWVNANSWEFNIPCDSVVSLTSTYLLLEDDCWYRLDCWLQNIINMTTSHLTGLVWKIRALGKQRRKRLEKKGFQIPIFTSNISSLPIDDH